MIRAKQKAGTLVICALVLCTLLASFGQQKAQAAEKAYYVYYTQSGELYRVGTDGKGEPEKLAGNTDPGRRCKRAGQYLFGLNSRGQLLRSDLSRAPHAQCDTMSDSVGAFDVKGNYVYYSKKARNTSVYRLFRLKADIDVSKSHSNGVRRYEEFEEEIASNLDYNYLNFVILDNKVYYTAKKDGRELWVACKNMDGSGSVKWIAKGALGSEYDFTFTADNIYMVLNTNPEERQYSTNCVVVYKVPRAGGAGKALNFKKPIDVNASYTGSWAGAVFYYNTGVKMTRYQNSFDEYMDYSAVKGYGVDMSGHRFTISDKGVVEMAFISGTTYVYCDRNGDTYSCTISKGKVSNSKKLNVSKTDYVRNLKKNGKRASTLLAGANGTYMLNSDMTVKKLTGVNWDIVYIFDDIDGIVYSNAGDEGRLYWMSADAKTNRRLSAVKPSAVVFVEPIE